MEQHPLPLVTIESPQQPLAVSLIGGGLDVILLPEPSFDQVTEGVGTNALEQTFLGVALGAVASVGVTLVSTDVSEAYRSTLHWVLAFAIGAALYFFIKAYRAYRRHRDRVEKIKKGPRYRVPPSGIPGLTPTT